MLHHIVEYALLFIQLCGRPNPVIVKLANFHKIKFENLLDHLAIGHDYHRVIVDNSP
jgi:hypothetical protein